MALGGNAHDYDQFLASRSIGYKGEMAVLAFLHANGHPEAERFDDCNLTYDIRTNDFTFEVKTDRKARTDPWQAAYVEYAVDKNGVSVPSGIMQTTADWWMHVLVGTAAIQSEALFIRTSRLREIAPQYKSITCGTGHAKVHKVPNTVMQSIARSRVPIELAL